VTHAQRHSKSMLPWHFWFGQTTARWLYKIMNRSVGDGQHTQAVRWPGNKVWASDLNLRLVVSNPVAFFTLHLFSSSSLFYRISNSVTVVTFLVLPCRHQLNFHSGLSLSYRNLSRTRNTQVFSLKVIPLTYPSVQNKLYFFMAGLLDVTSTETDIVTISVPLFLHFVCY
jgi:hypothetical protein